MRRVIQLFDKLEDAVRGWFSHYPILYAVVGGIGTVLVWRGVWHTTDFISAYYLARGSPVNIGTTDFPSPWDGLISLGIGLVILLVTGLFVASFIGDHIIISGVRHEKKVTEKTKEEVEEEEELTKRVHEELHRIGKRLDGIEEKLGGKNKDGTL